MSLSVPGGFIWGFVHFSPLSMHPCMMQLPETKKSMNFNISGKGLYIVLFFRYLHDTLKPLNSVVA
jgi:hypothetical protein